MTSKPACCIFVNPASGSNAEDSGDELSAMLAARGWEVRCVFVIPGDDLPSPAALEKQAIDVAVIYTGDGTANSVVAALDGWKGRILFLPGGTMNLLSKRLHGDATVEEILDIATAGGGLPRRIHGARCDAGLALAGLLVGPGTCWSKVRESMREGAIGAMASDALAALKQTSEGPSVNIEGMQLTRDEGYPLLELTPGEHGLQINGYRAQDALEYAEQAWATLRRRFREGPHDNLGLAEEMVITSADGSDLPCLVDGEPVQCASGSRFVLETTSVEFIATGHDH